MQPIIAFDLITIYEILRPLALNILGIAAFGIFIFNFYRFIARKDIFTLNLRKHNQSRRPALRKAVSVIFYTFKCLILYPVFVFFWFCVMAAFLYLLGRSQSTESIMLVAMGVVGAIRVCSYYKEALATDISKILPFALLGILIIDNSLLRVVDSAGGVREAALLWETLVFYLVAVVVIEFVMRMVTGLFGLVTGRGKPRSQRDREDAEPIEDTATEPKESGVLPQDPTVRATEPVWSPPLPVSAYRHHGAYSQSSDTPRWNGRDPLRAR